MSLNDCAGVRACFGAFEFEQLDVTYTIPSGAAQQTKEVLITPPGLKLAPAGLFD